MDQDNVDSNRGPADPTALIRARAKARRVAELAQKGNDNVRRQQEEKDAFAGPITPHPPFDKPSNRHHRGNVVQSTPHDSSTSQSSIGAPSFPETTAKKKNKKKPLYMRMVEQANRAEAERERERNEAQLRHKVERDKANFSVAAMKEHIRRHDELVQQLQQEAEVQRSTDLRSKYSKRNDGALKTPLKDQQVSGISTVNEADEDADDESGVSNGYDKPARIGRGQRNHGKFISNTSKKAKEVIVRKREQELLVDERRKIDSKEYSNQVRLARISSPPRINPAAYDLDKADETGQNMPARMLPKLPPTNTSRLAEVSDDESTTPSTSNPLSLQRRGWKGSKLKARNGNQDATTSTVGTATGTPSTTMATETNTAGSFISRDNDDSVVTDSGKGGRRRLPRSNSSLKQLRFSEDAQSNPRRVDLSSPPSADSLSTVQSGLDEAGGLKRRRGMAQKGRHSSSRPTAGPHSAGASPRVGSHLKGPLPSLPLGVRSAWVNDMLQQEPQEQRLLEEIYEAGFVMYFEEKGIEIDAAVEERVASQSLILSQHSLSRSASSSSIQVDNDITATGVTTESSVLPSVSIYSEAELESAANSTISTSRARVDVGVDSGLTISESELTSPNSLSLTTTAIGSVPDQVQAELAARDDKSSINGNVDRSDVGSRADSRGEAGISGATCRTGGRKAASSDGEGAAEANVDTDTDAEQTPSPLKGRKPALFPVLDD